MTGIDIAIKIHMVRKYTSHKTFGTYRVHMNLLSISYTIILRCIQKAYDSECCSLINECRIAIKLGERVDWISDIGSRAIRYS